jgi:transcriptional regulator with XRE-family HTH domain
MASRIALDFLDIVEERLDSMKITRADLAVRLGVSKGRVSRIFNSPANLTLSTCVKFAQAAGFDVSLVPYAAGEETAGPVHPSVFARTWADRGCPRDTWQLEERVPLHSSSESSPAWEEDVRGLVLWFCLSKKHVADPAGTLFQAVVRPIAPVPAKEWPLVRPRAARESEATMSSIVH